MVVTVFSTVASFVTVSAIAISIVTVIVLLGSEHR